MTRWISNSPWWLVSAGIHLVLLLGATLVYFEEILAYYAEDTFTVLTRSPLVHPEYESISTVTDPPRGRGLPLNTPGPDDPEDELACPGIDRIFFLCRRPVSTAIPYYRSSLNPGTIDAPRSSPQDRQSSLRARYRPPLCRLENGESAVLAALRWLARHQNADGSWSAGKFGDRCMRGTCGGPGESDYDTGVTGLALLANLGAGYSQLSKDTLIDPAFPAQPLPIGTTVKKGLQWLLSQQDPEGCIGLRGPKHLYNHAIATLALSEAYGMTGSQPLKAPAQKAIDFLVAAQNPGKGWRYSFRAGDTDTSVTGWAVMALKSAELSQLDFPPTAYAGALRWLEDVTETDATRRAGYTAAGTGKVFVPGRNEAWEDHPTMTAIGMMSRIFIKKTKADPAFAGVGLLTTDLPAWKPGSVDFYYWYYGTLALFQFDGPGGPAWRKWDEAMKAAVVPNQRKAIHSCENGSWDPSEDRWGSEGGRIYATALNCLMLESYYIYATPFDGRK